RALVLTLSQAIAVLNFEAPAQQVTQHAVGLMQALRLGATAVQPRPFGTQFDALLELGDQATLAHAGIAYKRDERHRAGCNDLLEFGRELIQFPIAAHQVCLDAVDAAAGAAK